MASSGLSRNSCSRYALKNSSRRGVLGRRAHDWECECDHEQHRENIFMTLAFGNRGWRIKEDSTSSEFPSSGPSQDPAQAVLPTTGYHGQCQRRRATAACQAAVSRLTGYAFFSCDPPGLFANLKEDRLPKTTFTRTPDSPFGPPCTSSQFFLSRPSCTARPGYLVWRRWWIANPVPASSRCAAATSCHDIPCSCRGADRCRCCPRWWPTPPGAPDGWTAQRMAVGHPGADINGWASSRRWNNSLPCPG